MGGTRGMCKVGLIVEMVGRCGKGTTGDLQYCLVA